MRLRQIELAAFKRSTTTRFRSLFLNHRPAGALLLALAAAAPASLVTGQEAVRASLAGEEAAEARRTAAASPGYYNVRLGPTAWNFSGAVGFEGNDNIRLTSENEQGDLIVRPEIRTRLVWPVTDQNNLNLAFASGYSAYVQHSELSRFFISPGSELSFEMYAGDFWINYHDRLSITEDSYQDPTAVGVGNYAQLQNDAGVGVTWDLNKALVKLGYDHINYTLLSGNAGAADASSDVFNLATACTLAPGLSTGLETGGGLLSYGGNRAAFRNATDWNVGPFFEMQITERMHLRADAGYTVYSPEASSARGSAGDFTGVYGQLSLNHRVNEFLSYTLSGGRTVNFAFFGGTIDLSSVELQANWKLIHGFELGTFFQYDHGAQIFAGQEDFDRYGPGLGVGRQLTRKLSGSLRYQYYQRQSNLAGAGYSVNSVTLGFTYQL